MTTPDKFDKSPLNVPLFTENVVGSQMAVNAHRHHVGYISSGCAEAAIIAEAVAAIASGEPRTVRYGAQ